MAIKRQAGFTLIELMIVVVVVAVLAAIAYPNFAILFEKMRLRGAAESLYADLYYARSEALKTKRWVTLSFSPGTDWCYGIYTPPPGTLSTSNPTTCDCTADPNTCTKVVTSAEHPGISMPDDNLSFTAIGTPKATAFEPIRGTTFINGTHAGTARFVSDDNSFYKNIVVSALGRIRIDGGHYHTE